jgi:hypothetical protein
MVFLGNCAVAQDSDQLVSVSITNGTTVVPRSVFTQTWTFTNTGTTTWSPYSSGYTLDMIGLDSLGAMPILTNSSGTYHFPRSAINSNKSIAPGQTASYSMNFIAPEAARSYTDYFQLNGSTFFGPTVTVQVVVGNIGNTNVFDRSRAISFANNYDAYFCPDGYFWINGSDFLTTNAYSFIDVPVDVTNEASGIGDDCAHFVSYCIGRGPYVRGGGLQIPSRATPTYGEPAASRIVNNCLLNVGYAVEVSSLSQMEPGDVIGWNWEGDTNVNDLDHVTLYTGNNHIASHAVSALDVGPAYFQNSLPDWRWHLIHILDYPSLWSSKAGNSMTFTWTTNWNGYSLYTNSRISGTWVKVTTKPTVTGITNKLTLTLPGSGAIYYRLQMP